MCLFFFKSGLCVAVLAAVLCWLYGWAQLGLCCLFSWGLVVCEYSALYRFLNMWVVLDFNWVNGWLVLCRWWWWAGWCIIETSFHHLDYCQAQPQLKLRLRLALIPASLATNPEQQIKSNFSVTSRPARELEFGTDTHQTNLIKIT